MHRFRQEFRLTGFESLEPRRLLTSTTIEVAASEYSEVAIVDVLSDRIVLQVYGNTESAPPRQIFITDGTQEGTRPIPGTAHASSYLGAGRGGYYFFIDGPFQNVPTQAGVWWSTGPEDSSPQLLISFDSFAQREVSFHNLLDTNLLMIQEEERVQLWRTNGTRNGTHLIGEVDAESVWLGQTSTAVFWILQRPGPTSLLAEASVLLYAVDVQGQSLSELAVETGELVHFCPGISLPCSPAVATTSEHIVFGNRYGVVDRVTMSDGTPEGTYRFPGRASTIVSTDSFAYVAYESQALLRRGAEACIASTAMATSSR